MTRLNLGCGTDYREGWTNVDANPEVRADVHQLIRPWSDLPRAEHVAAIDLLEHFNHPTACQLLRAWWRLLLDGGTLELRVPDAEWIIKSGLPIAEKLRWLFGGQDDPQGKAEAVETHRLAHPEHYCHGYGWTETSLTAALWEAGFKDIEVTHEGPNMTARARR